MNTLPSIILNVFQGPGAVARHTDTVLSANDRAWILKRVQDDVGLAGPAAC